MKLKFAAALFKISVITISCSTNPPQTKNEGLVERWLTTSDKTSLLEKSNQSFVAVPTEASTVVEFDTAQKYQSIDGFGYALTGGSAFLLNQKMSAGARDSLLRELFLRDGNAIGISYLRVSIGGSDLDDEPFTYLDLPSGKTDTALKAFTIDEDRKNLIPVLKEILKLSPGMKIMGSPWSAPAWMKTNNNLKGGSLKPEFYDAYARYFVRYIEEMKKEGIAIDAVTLQNEPENPNNTPSMLMTAEEQAAFVKNNLGPAFKAAGIASKIVVFDHNCDHPEYPIAILNDPAAKQFIDGSAFHLYLGEIGALKKVRDAHPDKNIYFTEQWTSGQGEFGGDLQWHVKNLIIGASRNWSRNVLEWNLAADPQFNPHTDDGGCTLCQGALTIGDSVTRNVSYYIIAHASKFVTPGSVRIETNVAEGLPNVGFITPEGKKVLIVLNEGPEEKFFHVRSGDRGFATSLAKGAVATFVW
jgi:glucosylceramidase